jgi:uracil-DNA glycosylase
VPLVLLDDPLIGHGVVCRACPRLCPGGSRSPDRAVVRRPALHRTGWASQPTSVAAGDGQTLPASASSPVCVCPPRNSPAAAERATCSAWLQRELELASPHLRAVLSLGAVGWDAVLAAARSISWQVPRPKPRFSHAAQTVLTTADGRSASSAAPT